MIEDLGGTVPGRTPREISQSFRAIRIQRPRRNDIVRHLSVRFAPEDIAGGQVTIGMKTAIANEVAEAIGWSAWKAVSHGEDFHIVGSVVGWDGELAPDSHTKRRAERTMRDVQARYGLRAVEPSPTMETHPTREVAPSRADAVQTQFAGNAANLDTAVTAFRSAKTRIVRGTSDESRQDYRAAMMPEPRRIKPR